MLQSVFFMYQNCRPVRCYRLCKAKYNLNILHENILKLYFRFRKKGLSRTPFSMCSDFLGNLSFPHIFFASHEYSRTTALHSEVKDTFAYIPPPHSASVWYILGSFGLVLDFRGLPSNAKSNQGPHEFYICC